jgi:hypothetical protein
MKEREKNRKERGERKGGRGKRKEKDTVKKEKGGKRLPFNWRHIRRRIVTQKELHVG